MTDETQQPLAGGEAPASVTPEVEAVAPDTTPDVAEEPETPETPDKPKGGFQRRIQELVSERNEYRRMLEADRRRLDQLVAMVAQRQAPEPEKAAPTLEQSGFDEQKYQAAVVEYAKAQARSEVQELLRQDRAEQQAKVKQESFRSREATFAEQTEDYRDTVYSDLTPISEAMAEVIRDSDVGPELAYYLGKNREVAASIYGLSPVAAARELGRLEAKLSAPKPAAPSIPKAPPPPPKVDAVEPEVDKDPEKMSDAEWIKWRNKQVSAARARSFIKR